MDNMETDVTNEKHNWVGWLILTAFIFTGLGYTWRWGQEQGIEERSYNAAVEELMVVVKDEVCQ